MNIDEEILVAARACLADMTSYARRYKDRQYWAPSRLDELELAIANAEDVKRQLDAVLGG